MRPTVYIETTIPSYYCDGRPELMRDILRTRQWWDREREDYECFVSPVVVEELSAGRYPSKADCLRLIERLAVLEIEPEVLNLAQAYQAHGIMPREPAADSVHVALATWYRVDYLLTWNCGHIANANKIRRIEALNATLHLGMPLLVTPHQLRPVEA
jgi:hypothetical protein